jgi:hypothetical protein
MFRVALVQPLRFIEKHRIPVSFCAGVARTPHTPIVAHQLQWCIVESGSQVWSTTVGGVAFSQVGRQMLCEIVDTKKKTKKQSIIVDTLAQPTVCRVSIFFIVI